MHYAKHGADISATEEALLDEAVRTAAAANGPADALAAVAAGGEATAVDGAHDAAQEQPAEMQAAPPLSSQPADTSAGLAPDADNSAQQQLDSPARPSPETSPGFGTTHGPVSGLGRLPSSCDVSTPVPDCHATALVCTEQLSISPAEQQPAALASAQQLRPPPPAVTTRASSIQHPSTEEQGTATAACRHRSRQQTGQAGAAAGALPLQPALRRHADSGTAGAEHSIMPAEPAHALSKSAAQLQLAASSAAGLFSTQDASCADQLAAVPADGRMLPWASPTPVHQIDPLKGPLTAGALLMVDTLLITQLGIQMSVVNSSRTVSTSACR